MRGRTILLAGVAVLVFAAPAVAQTSGSTDVLKIIENGLLPAIAEIMVTVLGLVGLYLAKLLRDKTGIDIEAQVRSIEANHREALHSAITTALGSAVAKYGPSLDVSNSSPAGQLIISSVKASVPEAVSALGATDSWIATAAESKLALTAVQAPAVAKANPSIAN